MFYYSLQPSILYVYIDGDYQRSSMIHYTYMAYLIRNALQRCMVKEPTCKLRVRLVSVHLSHNVASSTQERQKQKQKQNLVESMPVERADSS